MKKYEISQQILNAVATLLANAAHPNVPFSKVHELMLALDNLPAIKDPPDTEAK
jgi:hypothetical protein